jgi:hypothetical protein
LKVYFKQLIDNSSAIVKQTANTEVAEQKRHLKLSYFNPENTKSEEIRTNNLASIGLQRKIKRRR